MSRDHETTRTDESMSSVDHTHPYTGETFGHVYRRGPAATDGGVDDPQTDDGDRDVDDESAPTRGDDRMGDVDHAAPDGTGTNEVWVRGSTAPDPGAPAEE